MKLGRGGPYRATIMWSGVSADTWGILVDKSDYTNYPHPSTHISTILLKRLELTTEKASDGRYYISVGVVRENDGTDGSVDWITRWYLQADGNPTDGTDRFVDVLDFSNIDDSMQGLRCDVHGSAAKYFVCSSASGNVAALANAAGNLKDATGSSTKSAAIGDLVVFVDEISDSGTIDVCLSAIYDMT